MVLHRSANVETDLAVYIPCTSVFGFDVCHHRTSQWCKWALHVIMLPMHMCIYQYFGHPIALVKQIGDRFGGLDKVAPQRKGKLAVNSA
jgi:hypothetical protein